MYCSFFALKPNFSYLLHATDVNWSLQDTIQHALHNMEFSHVNTIQCHSCLDSIRCISNNHSVITVYLYFTEAVSLRIRVL